MRTFGKCMFSILVTLVLVLEPRRVVADAGNAKSPNRRVTVVKVCPLTTPSPQKMMLDALNNGDTQMIDRLLDGALHIDEVLCFSEELWPCKPCTSQIDTRILVPGAHIWHERPPEARALVDCFWRAYPRAADDAFGYGSIRLYGTPLMAACRSRNVKMVSFLLRRGANPNMFVKLGDGKWLYALREPYVNAVFARDRERAENICTLLAEAGAVMMDGDDLHAAVTLTPSAESVVSRLRQEEARLQQEEARLVAQQREAMQKMVREMKISELRRRSDAIRGEIEAEKYRQKSKEVQDEMARHDRANITDQTLGQYDTTWRLGLEKVDNGMHSDLRRDPMTGDLYKVDVHGNAYKINPHDGSLSSVQNK